uniref:Uncharacterized protein n=1 Tax=viral metagenome TaxID=1070528 RepID=A0A6C0F5S7_9ZZZZ
MIIPKERVLVYGDEDPSEYSLRSIKCYRIFNENMKGYKMSILCMNRVFNRDIVSIVGKMIDPRKNVHVIMKNTQPAHCIRCNYFFFQGKEASES